MQPARRAACFCAGSCAGSCAGYRAGVPVIVAGYRAGVPVIVAGAGFTPPRRDYTAARMTTFPAAVTTARILLLYILFFKNKRII